MVACSLHKVKQKVKLSNQIPKIIRRQLSAIRRHLIAIGPCLAAFGYEKADFSINY